MNLDDVILTILNESGDFKVSRTALQKLVYFTSEFRVVDTNFIAHYFGPFSPEVANEISELRGLGFIEERMEEFPTGNIGYFYRITSAGKQVIESEEEELKKIKTIVNNAKEHFFLSQSLLSIAAKAFYIIKKNDKPVTSENILWQAKNLGWEVSEEELMQVKDFLVDLKLITFEQ